MLFTFRRDDEGRERIYVGDVCVAEVETIQRDATATIRHARMVMHVQGVDYPQISQAIERADAAGFWETEDEVRARARREDPRLERCMLLMEKTRALEIVVDVPIPETPTTLTLVSKGDDES